MAMAVLQLRDGGMLAEVTNDDCVVYVCSAPQICGVCQMPRSIFVNRMGRTQCYSCGRRQGAAPRASSPENGEPDVPHESSQQHRAENAIATNS